MRIALSSQRCSRSLEASWDSLVVPLEEMQHRLARTWSPVGHMNGVVNSDELRAAYNACLPLLTAWHTELAQNERLYRAYETILANEGDRLTAGAAQAAAERAARLSTRRRRVAGRPARQRSRRWSNSWRRCNRSSTRTCSTRPTRGRATSPRQASSHGLPQPIVERARAAAQSRQLEGWFFTLDAPNYQAVMMHAENEALRRDFYQAWVTRASDQGVRRRPLGQHRADGADPRAAARDRAARRLSRTTPSTRSPPRWPRRSTRCARSSNSWRGRAARSRSASTTS